MMSKLNPKNVALTLGTFSAAMHLIWSILVAAGVAQGFINWAVGLHFISAPTHTVAAFDAMTAITLIVVAFVLAGLFGWLFATIWNKFNE